MSRLSKSIQVFMRENARKGGLARAAKLTPAQRLASSRKANQAKARNKKRVTPESSPSTPPTL